MTLSVRSVWEVMYSSVFALTVREIQNKFIKSVNTNRSLGFYWIILEPLLHIGIWISIRMFMGKLSFASTLSLPVFILLGAMPFFLFRNIVSSSKKAIKANKSYFLFRQIKPLDPFIAKLASELFVNIFVFIVILIILTWFNVPWHIYNLQFWLINLLSYSLFLFGISIIVAITGFFFTFTDTILGIVMRFSYLFSGIFFAASSLPKVAREYMLLNPVFQFIEISRQCFMPPYSYIEYASPSYLFQVALVSVLLGLGLYLFTRQKIMTEIEQR